MSKTIDKYKIIIIGAGAAGFMAAITAAQKGINTLLLDASEKIGEKIRISGGGRCNFTNIGASHENYLSQNKNFCRSALSKYKAEKFIDLVEKHGISYHEKKLGQLFCDDSSQEIITMLFKEAHQAGVEIYNPVKIKTVKKDGENFLLESSNQSFKCQKLIIATGGLSIPKIGASDFAHRIAKEFNLNIIPPRPALVPFTLEDDFFTSQSGLSFDAEVKLGKISFRENILFTHKGLSGPAILQISSYWQEGETITINLAPEIDIYEHLVKVKTQEKKKIKNIIKEIEFSKPSNKDIKRKIDRKFIFPEQYLEKLAEQNPDIDFEQSIAEASNKSLKSLANLLNNWQVKPNGTEGYAKAEVTLGGVDTKELDSKTMEAKKVPGLYFIGEAVDVTGWLGGYNFQWAWASGFAAGSAG